LLSFIDKGGIDIDPIVKWRKVQFPLKELKKIYFKYKNYTWHDLIGSLDIYVLGVGGN
jgi:hypothetical protein